MLLTVGPLPARQSARELASASTATQHLADEQYPRRHAAPSPALLTSTAHPKWHQESGYSMLPSKQEANWGQPFLPQ